jgi:glycosyltransferase involved in cell wall biosynthesis
MLKAVQRLDNVALAIGGEGPLMAEVQAAAAQCDRIHAIGWVPLEDVTGLVAASDVVYYGLEASNPNSVYFMPTLAFFALAAGRPLLLTPVGEIAEVAEREGFGWVMETPTPDAAERALRRMCDPATRAALAHQALVSGAERYHWGYAASQLWAAYQHIRRVESVNNL